MAPAPADRNLLFGILALQMDFVTRDDLIAAMHDWAADKTRPLGQILCDRGALSRARHDLLDALVEEHLAAHGHDPNQSLAAVGNQAAGNLSEITKLDFRARSASTAPSQRPSENGLETQSPEEASFKQAPASSWRADEAGGPAAGPRFRPLRPHARGGIGEVFVARDEELNREVALKELQTSLAGWAEAKARFAMEAEITGRLEHPGVVPVYGLGHYPDGRPYYAMRFIRGESFLEAIDRFHSGKEIEGDPGKRRLALRDLLRRFVDACNAVAYAHSRGVLHRDLKPANVMLGKYGETLVVDWGLAKLLDQPTAHDPAGDSLVRPASVSDSAQTEMGQVVGTPAYMSPEQAGGQLDQLGPASDVYSLGAMLYHVLTGRPPIARGELTTMLTQVRDGKFPRPRQVKRGVPVGLEAVCLKAMAPRPSDRYPTAEALAEDVEHWLADEPVMAQRESAIVRLRRWGRRHRPLVVGSVVLLGTALLALALSTFFLSREWEKTRQALHDQTVEKLKAEQARADARAEADKADQAERRARTQAETARRASGLLKGLFLTSDPIGLTGLGFRGGSENAEKLTARQLLDRARDHVVADTNEDPAVRAVMLDAIGDVYRSLGHYQEAEPLLKEAVRLCQEKIGPDELETADSLHHLGWLLHDRGLYDEARPLYERAWRIRLDRLGPDDPQVATSLFHRGWLEADDKNYPAAEKHFREAIAIRRKALGPNSREVGIALAGLAATLFDARRTLEAMTPFKEALPILVKDQKEGEKVMAAAMAFLSGLSYKQAPAIPFVDPARKAVDSFREALDLAKPYLGADHPYVGFIIYELADALEKAGDRKEAERLYRESLRIAKGSVGLHHPKVVAPMYRLMLLLGRQKRTDEARQLLDQFVAARRAIYGNYHKMTAQALYLRGTCEELFGAPAEALPYLREAVAILEQTKDPPEWSAATWIQLGRAYRRTGNPAEAEAPLRRGLEWNRKHVPPLPGETVVALTALAGVLADRDKLADAEPLLAEAESICRKSLNRPDLLASVLELQARLCRARGDEPKAKELSREAGALRKAPPS